MSLRSFLQTLSMPVMAFLITNANSSAEEPALPLSPAQVVISALKAANAGQYDQANACCTEKFLNLQKFAYKQKGEMKGYWDTFVGKGGIDDVEALKIRSEKVDGEKAKVRILGKRGGTPMTWSMELTKANGEWKITMP